MRSNAIERELGRQGKVSAGKNCVKMLRKSNRQFVRRVVLEEASLHALCCAVLIHSLSGTRMRVAGRRGSCSPAHGLCPEAPAGRCACKEKEGGGGGGGEMGMRVEQACAGCRAVCAHMPEQWHSGTVTSTQSLVVCYHGLLSPTAPSPITALT